MTLKEIIEKCSTLSIYEKREITDEYVELVFLSKETDEWNRILSEILGPAIKPAGVKHAKTDLILTAKFGGVREEQTLFKKEFDDADIIAMFWPWQNGEHTTLKMFVKK